MIYLNLFYTLLFTSEIIIYLIIPELLTTDEV